MAEKKDGSEFLLDDVPSLIGRKFKIVRGGLNKKEVFEFIAQLVESNNEKAKKLEHIESLRRLGETTVIEAGNLAETIKAEIIDRASEEATAILAEAEKKAITDAERIILEAEQQAQDMLASAGVELEKIKKATEDQANMIITEANKKVKESIISAEKQARDILQNAQEKAEALKEATEIEVQTIKQQADELIEKSQKVASNIRYRFEEILRSVFSNLELDLLGTEQLDAASSDENNSSPELGSTS